MNYREKLMELIMDDDEDKMMAWIESQPLIEQPDIFRELKLIAEEAAALAGDNVLEEIEGFENFDNQINNYEEAILTEKLAEVNLNMALDEQEKVMTEMFERVAMMKEYVIECIVNDEPNANEMRQLVEHIIVFEKGAEIYDPETWKIIGL